jgi:hypothetical protein
MHWDILIKFVEFILLRFLKPFERINAWSDNEINAKRKRHGQPPWRRPVLTPDAWIDQEIAAKQARDRDRRS